MTITAKTIADSISPEGIRLSTLQLRYPKFIHGEFMTHRVFSRNASSSRAIPVDRLIKDVMEDPAMPIHWGKNQKGMQAEQECDTPVQYGIIPRSNHIGTWNEAAYITNEEAWLKARDNAVGMARAFTQAGYHKQIVNRLLEPFCHINVVVTATEFSNFFALRDHPDAQPEIRELAQRMKEAMAASTPKLLQPGEWHLPYVDDDSLTADVAIRLSVARCARVSYLTQDGRKPEIAEDLALYDRLIAGVPLHASPAEHQGTPDWSKPYYHGNFKSWIQYRKTLSGECQ
jgi:hypothetical protein